MSKNTIRIGLVMGSDFRGYPAGGAQPTIEIFLKYAQDRAFDIWLFGLATTPDEAIGQVSKRRIYGRDYSFVPLFYLDAARYANHRPLVPFRVQAFLAYLRRRRLLDAMGFDLLYLHAPEALPFLWRKRQPVLYHLHGPQEGAARYSRYPIFQTRAFAYLYHLWIRSILARADEFIAIDRECYDRYTQWMPGKKEHFHLLPTAIDVEQFRPLPGFDAGESRRRFGLPPEGKMVLFVGRLSWMKGVDLVIRAFSLAARQLPDAFLAVAGEGEKRNELETLASELGIREKVFFLGRVAHLPSPDLPCLFNCADISLVGSFNESLALVITEALACGTPVVSTPVGIAPDVIRDGVTGYLVHSRKPAEMASRMVQVLRDASYSSAECVKIARNYAETSRPICDVIERLCPENRSGSRTARGSSPGSQVSLANG